MDCKVQEIQKVFKKRCQMMNGDHMNYSELQKRYGGGFVAFLGGEVVAHGKTFGDVLEKVKKRVS